MESSEGYPRGGPYRARLKADSWPPTVVARAEESVATGLGQAPTVILVGAAGLVVLALAAYGSRTGQVWGEVAFWLGLLVLVVPVALRLAMTAPSRVERQLLVLWLGFALYLVKVFHSPFTFTFADEPMHAFNVERIVETGHLFFPNSILPVTPLYPGIALVTAAIVSTTGLSTFAAGLLVVGAARLVLLLAIFLLTEVLTGSRRAAGLAAMFYMANANFVFWSAQFAYESLALPLAVAVLYLLARRASAPHRGAYTAAGMVLMLAIVITHHLTAFALILFLFGATILGIVPSLRRRGSSPWDVALVGGVAAIAWLVAVAPVTISYLGPVLLGAGRSALELVSQQAPSRELFQSATGYVAPLWERLVGLSSVGLIALGLAPGLYHLWRRRLRHAFALLLAGGSLAFLGMQALRLSPASWETANRSSEFLFLGVAFVLGLGAAGTFRAGLRRPAAVVVLAAYTGVVFLGGIIAGWQPPARLSLPYRIMAEGQVIEPAGVVAARWAQASLGTNNVVLADETSARQMLWFGKQSPLTGKRYGVRDLIWADSMGDGEREILRVTGARYVVVDRRLISWNSLVGQYFASPIVAASAPTDLLDISAQAKFDGLPGVDRLYDSGNLAIYDVGVLNGGR